MQKGHAQTIRQLKRDLDLLPRTAEKKRRSDKKIIRKDGITINGFRIHKEFSCVTNKNIPDFNIQEISEQSTIDVSNLSDPQTFSLAIHIIKAHLNIALRSYFVKGFDIGVEKYPLRYHSQQELEYYPLDIALEPNETMRAFFPDTVRSVAYIQYIILPNLEAFLGKNKDYDLFYRLMRVLSFEDVIKEKAKRTLWTYKEYQKYIQTAFKLLNKIENDFLNTFKINKNTTSFTQDILSQLLLHNWISYLALRSCGFIPFPEDPLYDANLYYDATPARDNYFMGMGIFEEFKNEFEHYKQKNPTKNFTAIDNYIVFFNQFYKIHGQSAQDIEPSPSDTLPFDKIKKNHIGAVCALKDMPYHQCYRAIDMQISRFENADK